jgi:hypothetical protein
VPAKPKLKQADVAAIEPQVEDEPAPEEPVGPAE